MDVKIRARVGRALRPDQLEDQERIEMAIENAIALSLQVLFESVSLEEVYVIPSYLDDSLDDPFSNTSPSTCPFIS